MYNQHKGTGEKVQASSFIEDCTKEDECSIDKKGCFLVKRAHKHAHEILKKGITVCTATYSRDSKRNVHRVATPHHP